MPDEEIGSSSTLVPLFQAKSLAYLPREAPELFTLVRVLAQSGPNVTLRLPDSSLLNLSLLQTPLFHASTVFPDDLTALPFLNTPSILFSLEARSYSNKPYTFVSNVLLAVNPVNRHEISGPSPGDLAKRVVGALKFKNQSQSLVLSGQSGSGKTETAKLLMKEALFLCGEEGQGLRAGLLESNVVLEAFGNSRTTRNHNSSRFGKFIRLRIKSMKIIGADIETYLLEKSRIVVHSPGESNYHVFYLLRHLRPLPESSRFILDSDPLDAWDTKQFERLENALDMLGFDKPLQGCMWDVLFGVLHLGTVNFEEEFVANETVAIATNLGEAAKCLGLEESDLGDMLTTRKIKVGSEVSVAKMSAAAAQIAVDAFAKTVYSNLFGFVVKQVSKSLSGDSVEKTEDESFIGILDIFGFEVFETNSFEQLLINFTNETLQKTFNASIFDYELGLYKSEGLITDIDAFDSSETDNCLQLFNGDSDVVRLGSKLSRKDRLRKLGVLRMVDQETSQLRSSDEKLCTLLHSAFAKHASFHRIKPVLQSDNFAIKHFSGPVTYNVTGFLAKNRDAAPDSTFSLLSGSSNPVLVQFAEGQTKTTKSSKKRTLVAAFSAQIRALVEELEATDLSFVRCIKPNQALFRDESPTWFDRQFVMGQLRDLAVESTVGVLQAGFPTRVPYAELTNKFESLSKETQAPKLAVAALLYAFNVPTPSYKLGMSMAFFRAGQLAKIEAILKAEETQEIRERFRSFYVRRRWNRVRVKVRCCVRMFAVLRKVRERERKRVVEVRRRWRVAIYAVMFSVELNKIYEGVKRKEAERQREIEEKRKKDLEFARQRQREVEELQRQMELEKQRQKELEIQREKELEEKKIRQQMEDRAAKLKREAAERLEKEQLEAEAEAVANEERLRLEATKSKSKAPSLAKSRSVSDLFMSDTDSAATAKITGIKEDDVVKGDLFDPELVQSSYQVQRTAKPPSFAPRRPVKPMVAPVSVHEDASDAASISSVMTGFERRRKASMDFTTELFHPRLPSRPKVKKSLRTRQLEALEFEEEILDPFQRLKRLQTRKFRRLSESQIHQKAREAVESVRQLRAKSSEKMHNAMRDLALAKFPTDEMKRLEFLRGFEQRIQKAKKKDEDKYEELLKVEVSKIKLEQEKRIRKIKRKVSLAVGRKSHFDLFESSSSSNESVSANENEKNAVKQATVIARNVLATKSNIRKSMNMTMREKEEENDELTTEIARDLVQNTNVAKKPWFKQANKQALRLLGKIRKKKAPPTKSKPKPTTQKRKPSQLDEATTELPPMRFYSMRSLSKSQASTAADSFSSSDELDFDFSPQDMQPPQFQQVKRVRRNGFKVDRFVVVDEFSPDQMYNATAQQFKNLDSLAESNQISTQELFRLKKNLARKTERRFSVMPSAHARAEPMPSISAHEVAEQEDSDYLDSVKWDLDKDMFGGNLRISLQTGETSNKIDEFGVEKTFFTSLCVFSHGAGVEVDEKFAKWRVVHTFGDFVSLNDELHDAESHLGGLVRGKLTPLVLAKDKIEEKNFYFFGNTLKIWFDHLSDALRSPRLAENFFKEAGYFWEIQDNIDME